MANPYEPPSTTPEVGDDVAPPAWLERFRDPAPQANWVVAVCLVQLVLMTAMFLLEAPPVRDFGGRTLLRLSLPIELWALLSFSKVTTQNAKLFRAEPLEASRYWPLWLLLPLIGVGPAYVELRKVSQASGAPSAYRFAGPWLLCLAVFMLYPLIPNAHPIWGTSLFFVGQLCLVVVVRTLRDGQIRLVRLAAVAQALIDARPRGA